MRLPVQEQRREAAGFPGVVRLAGTACRGVPGCLCGLSAGLRASCIFPARVICNCDSAAHNKQCANKMMYVHDMSLRFLLRRYGKPSG